MFFRGFCTRIDAQQDPFLRIKKPQTGSPQDALTEVVGHPLDSIGSHSETVRFEMRWRSTHVRMFDVRDGAALTNPDGRVSSLLLLPIHKGQHRQVIGIFDHDEEGFACSGLGRHRIRSGERFCAVGGCGEKCLRGVAVGGDEANPAPVEVCVSLGLRCTHHGLLVSNGTLTFSFFPLSVGEHSRRADP